MHMKRLWYLFANWKMYVGARESVSLAKKYKALAKKLSRSVTMAVFPSALTFQAIKKEVGMSVRLGAQNIHWVGKGGATGEVSAEMYKTAGATYALVGHSERRHLFHETNREVRQKMEAALAAGLIPVLCVGETKTDKQSGITEEIIEAQIRAAYTDIDWPTKVPLIVAYEPVWAISHGTGKNEQGEYCAPDQAELTHELIIHFVKGLVPHAEPIVLYGGSVRPTTIAAYAIMPHVSGVLVGAASTQARDWQAIIKNAQLM